jgi:hypothetical protein
VGGHVDTYVANGSHASYEEPCTHDCPHPILPFIDEADHDGLAHWAENSDCGQPCVLPLPTAGPLSSQGVPQTWAYWPGKWGADQFDIDGTGDSPDSPGGQSRFTCTQAGWNCPQRQSGMPLRVRGARQKATGTIPNPRLCESWAGIGVGVLACDQAVLDQTVQLHRTMRRGPLHISVRGRRTGDASGIVQVIGGPLHASERLTLTGTTSRGMSLTIQAYGRRHRLFRISVGEVRLLGRRGVLQLSTRGGVPALGRASGIKLGGVSVRVVKPR